MARQDAGKLGVDLVLRLQICLQAGQIAPHECLRSLDGALGFKGACLVQAEEL